jgi:hypothetical protein
MTVLPMGKSETPDFPAAWRTAATELPVTVSARKPVTTECQTLRMRSLIDRGAGIW